MPVIQKNICNDVTAHQLRRALPQTASDSAVVGWVVSFQTPHKQSWISPDAIPFTGKAQAQDPWLAKSLRKVESFAALEKGWDGYRAETPTATARWLARTALEAMALLSIKPDDVGPSVVGGIGISLARSTRSAYVELYNDGQAYVLLDAGTGPPDIRPWPSDRESLSDLARFVGDYIDGS